MLIRGLMITAVSAAVGVLAAPAALTVLAAPTAVADPEPAPPPLPDVTGYMPMNAADYTVNGGKWYAFAGPPGVVCVIDSFSGEYGCSGPLPGVAEGVNLVSGGPSGAPKFSTTAAPPYAAAGVVKALPPNRRLSFRQIFCGVDDAGVVTCMNSQDKTGFVIGATSTYIQVPPPPPPAAPAPAPAPAG
jgi:hypothetical protein